MKLKTLLKIDTAILLAGVVVAGTVFYNTVTITKQVESKPSASLMKKAFQNTLRVDFGRARCSATYIDKGIAVTASHCCLKFKLLANDNVQVKTFDDKFYKVLKYEVHPKAMNVDVCLLKLPSNLVLPGTKLANPEDLVLNQVVIIPSYAGGVRYSIRSGTILSEELVDVDPVTTMPINITTAMVEGGASGSGALNVRGELVGVTVLRLDQFISGIIPLRYIIEAINQTEVGRALRK